MNYCAVPKDKWLLVGYSMMQSRILVVLLLSKRRELNNLGKVFLQRKLPFVS